MLVSHGAPTLETLPEVPLKRNCAVEQSRRQLPSSLIHATHRLSHWPPLLRHRAGAQGSAAASASFPGTAGTSTFSDICAPQRSHTLFGSAGTRDMEIRALPAGTFVLF